MYTERLEHIHNSFKQNDTNDKFNEIINNSEVVNPDIPWFVYDSAYWDSKQKSLYNAILLEKNSQDIANYISLRKFIEKELEQEKRMS